MPKLNHLVNIQGSVAPRTKGGNDEFYYSRQDRLLYTRYTSSLCCKRNALSSSLVRMVSVSEIREISECVGKHLNLNIACLIFALVILGVADVLAMELDQPLSADFVGQTAVGILAGCQYSRRAGIVFLELSFSVHFSSM